MVCRINVLLAVLLIFATLFTPAQAAPDAPGNLDPTFAGFGVGGIATGPQITNANGMVLQPDGKVLVASQATGPFSTILRYQLDGQLDEAFGGGDGLVDINPPLFSFYARDIALQGDGRIVVAGYGGSSGADGENFMLVRLTGAGELDSSFGDQGYVITDFDEQIDDANAVLIQPDGKIVVAGYARVGGDTDFAVARYNVDGSLDNDSDGDGGFGGDGKVTIGFGGHEQALDMARQSDGKLVLVGVSGTDFALARLNPGGSLDNSFDGDGKRTDSFGGNEHATAVALQPDGKIVVAGKITNPGGSFVARYLSNGDRDTSGFGDNGKHTFSSPTQINDLALQPDGKIMIISELAGSWVFYRVNPLGGLDTSFGNDGDVLISPGGLARGADIALLPDGRILGLGQSKPQGTSIVHLNLVRLWPDGTLDSGGKQAHVVITSDFDGLVSALAVQPDGKLLVTGELRDHSGSGSDAFVTRFRADGQVDTGFGSQGTIRAPTGFLAPPFRGARAIAVQPDGKIVIAGYAGWGGSFPANFLVTRWHGNGTADGLFGFGGNTSVNFSGNGDDYGTALALAPDGKIVIAGNVWNGSRQVWGVARLSTDGTPDTSFGANHNGMAYVDFNSLNAASAVVVQPDGKIIIGGYFNDDFALARLTVAGVLDTSFGATAQGLVITQLGGIDRISALALAPNGFIYAGGSREVGGDRDFALVQYKPNGLRVTCSVNEACHNWPTGTYISGLGGNDSVNALALRSDGQLMAAGCWEGRFAGVQLRTDGDPIPSQIMFNTGFISNGECAFGVGFTGNDRLVMAGRRSVTSNTHIALAKFETLWAGNPPVYRVFTPLVAR